LVDDYPFSPRAWFLLGTALLRSQDVGAALAALQRAAQVRPGFAPGQLWLGKAYEASGRQGQALDAFARAVWLAPDDVQAHINYGRLLLLLRRPDSGYRHVRRGMSLMLARAGRRVLERVVLAARCHQVAARLIRRRGRGGLRMAALEVLAEHAQSEECFAAAASLATAALRRLPNDGPEAVIELRPRAAHLSHLPRRLVRRAAASRGRRYFLEGARRLRRLPHRRAVAFLV
jgi:tetratricopeptide (TPR) repeat protein